MNTQATGTESNNKVQSVIKTMEDFCDEREQASWNVTEAAIDGNPVLAQEEAIRDTISLFQKKLKELREINI